MGKRMEKDALLVLCVLAVAVVAWFITTQHTVRELSTTVRITDTRTEHLRDRIQSLEKRTRNLENKVSKRVKAIR